MLLRYMEKPGCLRLWHEHTPGALHHSHQLPLNFLHFCEHELLEELSQYVILIRTIHTGKNQQQVGSAQLQQIMSGANA